MTLPVLSNSISLGPVSIHWYGLLVVVGIVAGYAIVRYLAQRFVRAGRDLPLRLDNLFFHLIIWGFIGARLYHVFNEPAYYWNQPIEILKFWSGGLAIHGAILVGVLVIFYFSHKYLAGEKSEIRISKSEINSNFQNSKQESVIPNQIWDPETKNKQKKNSFVFLFSFLDSCLRRNDVRRDSCLRRNDVRRFFFISDILVIGLAVGQAIGRWGNYFNQELFGKPTNGFFKVFIDAAHRPVGFENVAYYHPTFLYESVLNLILFAILFFAFRKIYSPAVIPDSIGDPETKSKQKQTVIASEATASVAISFGAHNEIASSQTPRNDNQKVTSYRLQATGLTTSLYLLGYGLIRFFIDFVRIDPRPFFGGLYLSQWVSLGMIVIGVAIWYNAVRKRSYQVKENI